MGGSLGSGREHVPEPSSERRTARLVVVWRFRYAGAEGRCGLGRVRLGLLRISEGRVGPCWVIGLLSFLWFAPYPKRKFFGSSPNRRQRERQHLHSLILSRINEWRPHRRLLGEEPTPTHRTNAGEVDTTRRSRCWSS